MLTTEIIADIVTFSMMQTQGIIFKDSQGKLISVAPASWYGTQKSLFALYDSLIEIHRKEIGNPDILRNEPLSELQICLICEFDKETKNMKVYPQERPDLFTVVQTQEPQEI